MSNKEISGKVFMEGLLGSGPYFVVVAAFAIAVLAMISLLMVDIVTGEVTSAHVLASAKYKYMGWFMSLATTGLLIATFGVGIKSHKEGWGSLASVALFAAGIVFQIGDIWADAVSVDIMRFGAIVFPKEVLAPSEVTTHYVFRAFVAGVSFFGEPLAAASIVIFPVLKNLLNDLLTAASRTSGSESPFGKHHNEKTRNFRPVSDFSQKNRVLPSFSGQNKRNLETNPLSDAELHQKIVSLGYKVAKRPNLHSVIRGVGDKKSRH